MKVVALVKVARTSNNIIKNGGHKMGNFEFKGVAVYVPTPLTDSDEINLEEFKRHVKFVISGGCNAIIPGGAAGQQVSLSWEEQRKIISTVVEEFGSQVFCIAYTSSPYTKEAIDRTREAKNLGAHSVNLLAPWYTLPTSEEIYLHFKKIAESVDDFPITLYNNERRPNVVIPWQVTVRLAREHKNIVGIKEANLLNAYYILAELREVRPDFTVINGTPDIFLPYFMAIGGAGTFSWVENIAPGLVTVPLFKALKENDYNKAREILFKYRDLIDMFVVADPVPLNLHFMLNSMGWKMGIPRAPYNYPPSEKMQETYLSVLKKYGLLK